MSRVSIVVFVPTENADDVRMALGKAGAGVLGDYTFCSFSVNGTGRFLPSEGADPHIGEPGEFQSVNEERIEVKCEREKARNVIAIMKKAHPYEEVAFDVYALIEEEDL